MKGDLESILASDDSLEPSSGFARGVMEAVGRQAAEPPPMRFPWRRFALGIAACLVSAAAGAEVLGKAAPALAALAAPFAPAAPLLACGALAAAAGLALARLPRALARG